MLFQRVPEAHHAAKEDTGDDFLMPQKLSSAKEDKDPGAHVHREPPEGVDCGFAWLSAGPWTSPEAQQGEGGRPAAVSKAIQDVKAIQE